MILWCSLSLLKTCPGLAAACESCGSTASSCPLDLNAGRTGKVLLVGQGRALGSHHSTVVVRTTFLKVYMELFLMD